MKKWMPLAVLAVAVLALFCVRSIFPNKHDAQMVLAQETHKAMSAMMADFREARSTTIEGVPADGKWYHTVAFEKGQEGIVRYEVTPASHELRRTSTGFDRTVARYMDGLNIRRQSGALDIFEVQLQAKNQAELVSNFKIRTRD